MRISRHWQAAAASHGAYLEARAVAACETDGFARGNAGTCAKLPKKTSDSRTRFGDGALVRFAKGKRPVFDLTGGRPGLIPLLLIVPCSRAKLARLWPEHIGKRGLRSSKIFAKKVLMGARKKFQTAKHARFPRRKRMRLLLASGVRFPIVIKAAGLAWAKKGVRHRRAAAPRPKSTILFFLRLMNQARFGRRWLRDSYRRIFCWARNLAACAGRRNQMISAGILPVD